MKDFRFWLVQLLVVAITVFHGVIEYVEERHELTGFLDGVHQLPVPAYVVPVLLSGFWFGYRGALLTGLFTMALSVPNLFLFHPDDYAWLGEGVTNALVLTVGVAVAAAVDRSDRLRRQAEANNRRLATLWDVAGDLSRDGSEADIAGNVTSRLAALDAVEAAGFFSANGAKQSPLMAAGGAEGIRCLEHAVADGGGDGCDGVLSYDVATDRHRFGQLLLACGRAGHCADDDMVYSLVAKEMAAVMENLNDREEQRSALQRYARAITSAQETERTRIARELHDGPAQAMVALARGLEQLQEQFPPSSPPTESAGELRTLVHQTLRSLQRTTLALRPPVLDDLGLVAALRSLVDRRTARGIITVRLEVRGEERRLDPDTELAAYRIAQEALTNVERHAGTDAATVLLDFEANGCTLLVSDTGVGFGPDAPARGESFGLVGMKERAETVAGTLTVTSRPGGGTTVEFSVAS